jgi:hypothetical protein
MAKLKAFAKPETKDVREKGISPNYPSPVTGVVEFPINWDHLPSFSVSMPQQTSEEG